MATAVNEPANDLEAGDKGEESQRPILDKDKENNFALGPDVTDYNN